MSNGHCCGCQNVQKQLWRNANIEKVRALNIANQKLHRDSANIRCHRYRVTHREILRADSKARQLAHPERLAAVASKRRASKLQRTPTWADYDAINMIYRAAQVIRDSGYDIHVDHIVPLQGRIVSGLHVHNNLRIIDARQNQSKSNIF